MYIFDTPAPITTTLDIPAGSVQFTATDRAETTVRVQPANPAKNSDLKAAARTTVDYTDGVLRIHTPATGNQLLVPTGALTITLPTGVDAQLCGPEHRRRPRVRSEDRTGTEKRAGLARCRGRRAVRSADPQGRVPLRGISHVRNLEPDTRWLLPAACLTYSTTLVEATAHRRPRP